MKSLDIAELHRAMLALSKIESDVRLDKVQGGGESRVSAEISTEFKTRVSQNLMSMIDMAHIMETPVTSKAVQRLRHRIESKVSYWDVAEKLADIQSRMTDELETVTTFVLERKNKELLQETEKLFGDEFATKFKSAGLREMTEAAKCRAYGLTTAAVFHLMRCMEIGVRTVAKCLGIPDPVAGSDRNWGNMLQKIKAKMAANGQGGTWQPGDREKFEAAYGSLDAVRAAWRNPTMHIENNYDANEAEHIFLAVREFMRTLASRMDEEGKPLA